MLQRSTIQLLRFHFSVFLMPVYWFALSVTEQINIPRAILVFLILHGLVYPSSNGYNSYMDRDEGSIGGVAKPMQPTRQLFLASVTMDIVAIILSFWVSTIFAGCVFLYIICSRLYSFRGIRLKQFPILGYLIVMLVQGALTFFMVYHGSDLNLATDVTWLPILSASFLIGGFYPITQIYQHQADREDGVTTISMLLGKKGTFLFCAGMYGIAMLLLWFFYLGNEQTDSFLILLVLFFPVVLYFSQWFFLVLRDESNADFEHTMTMNWLASICTNIAFITIILLNKFG